MLRNASTRLTLVLTITLIRPLTISNTGKLSLYCAAGGIAPHRVLPVVIDVGTENEELLNDKFYLGVQKRRLQGKAYYEVIDEFMQAVRYRWPNVLVQFEDFSSDKAQVRDCCSVVFVDIVLVFCASLVETSNIVVSLTHPFVPSPSLRYSSTSIVTSIFVLMMIFKERVPRHWRDCCRRFGPRAMM